MITSEIWAFFILEMPAGFFHPLTISIPFLPK
jgi:hypothetical protein